MKIVDLSTDVGGQWAAKLFAMEGITVLRPTGGADRPAALASYLDAGKQLVAWPGPSILDDADVVFTTFDAGSLTGFARGIEIPRSSIKVTTSTFGTTGPYAGYRGGPLAAWAASGYLFITGKPDREPLMGPEYLCEYVAGYTAAIAAEVALRRKRVTGRIEEADVAAMEAMLPMHQTTFCNLAFGEPRRRMGRDYEVYPMAGMACRDGSVVISPVTDEEFDRLVLAIGIPEILGDERFATGHLRFQHRDALDAVMEPFLMGNDAEDIVDLLEQHRVAATKVAEAEDIRANPQLAYRGFWRANSTPGNPLPSARNFMGVGEPQRRDRLVKEEQPPRDLPLSGVVVADFSVFWAGPSATRALADLGARVIWVERPGSRQPFADNLDPSLASPSSLYVRELARNKESLVLDLATAGGLQIARDLIASCDVVIENNRPGAMDKLGLGAEAMCSADPNLVYVSLPGFGSAGPWSQRRSYGSIIEGASGMVGRTGYAGDEPLRLGHTLPDPVGGLAGTLAALRGLRQREEGGGGGWFDISQLETYVAISGEELIGDAPLPRIGNASRSGSTIGIFPAAGDDEWLAVRLVGEADWARFEALIGAGPDDRDAVSAITQHQGKFDLAARFQGAGVEAFPVLKPEDLSVDPHLKERGMLSTIAFAGREAIVASSPFGKFADVTGRAPDFDEHGVSIIEELHRLGGRQYTSG